MPRVASFEAPHPLGRDRIRRSTFPASRRRRRLFASFALFASVVIAIVVSYGVVINLSARFAAGF
jgi:hypothetical protein